MQQFLVNELQKSDRNHIYEVFKESEFMLSLFCLSLSIDSLITQNNKQKIQEYITMCKISFFSFWKILSLLAKNLASSLPVIIRSRIVELEHYILLRLIWQTDMSSKNEADVILKQTGIQHKIAVKQLLYILIERIYLISQGIHLSPLLVQKVWEFMSFLLQQHTKNKKTRLENIHLDQILIVTFNHVRVINQIYGGLAQILKVYNDRCLFPINNSSKEALVQYYKYQFQELLNTPHGIQFKIKKQKKVNENPNSTPIGGNQFKKFSSQIKDSPEIESFEFKLDKKQQLDPESCSLFTRKDSIKLIKKQSRLSFQQNLETSDPSLNQNIKGEGELLCWSKLSENNVAKKDIPAENITMTTPFFTDDDFQFEVKHSGQKTPTF